jgi:hypothetical protein
MLDTGYERSRRDSSQKKELNKDKSIAKEIILKRENLK